MHYKRAGHSPRTSYEVVCVECGATFRGERKTAKFCTDACKGDAYRTRNALPADHPVMQLIAISRAQRKAKAERISLSLECAWCGTGFVTTKTAQKHCRYECKRKAIRVRRRGRQHGSTSHYTWAEVMRLFIKMDRRCAYCEQPVDGLPDPDHVVPLSRGGSNSMTNILPCCSPCNSDKRDLLLAEWAVDRQRRGLAPRSTDPRAWTHLTDAMLVA